MRVQSPFRGSGYILENRLLWQTFFRNLTKMIPRAKLVHTLQKNGLENLVLSVENPSSGFFIARSEQ
jgi:hypothetical protein